MHYLLSAKGKYLYNQIENNISREFSSMDLYSLYKSGKGIDVTLSQIGLQSKVQNAVENSSTLSDKAESVQDRFIEQIKGGSDYFVNCYNFGEVSWAIGKATLSGSFDGNISNNEDGTMHIEGSITYSFYDNFSDPYDTLNMVDGDFNPDGCNYKITETWTVIIEGDF